MLSTNSPDERHIRAYPIDSLRFCGRVHLLVNEPRQHVSRRRIGEILLASLLLLVAVPSFAATVTNKAPFKWVTLEPVKYVNWANPDPDGDFAVWQNDKKAWATSIRAGMDAIYESVSPPLSDRFYCEKCDPIKAIGNFPNRNNYVFPGSSKTHTQVSRPASPGFVGPLTWIQWTKENNGNDHWYAITLISAGNNSFTQHVAESKVLKAHLATITSALENQFLDDHLALSGGMIGLSRLGGTNDPDPIPPKKHGYWRVNLRTGERTWVDGIAGQTPLAGDRANLRVPTPR